MALLGTNLHLGYFIFLVKTQDLLLASYDTKPEESSIITNLTLYITIRHLIYIQFRIISR